MPCSGPEGIAPRAAVYWHCRRGRRLRPIRVCKGVRLKAIRGAVLVSLLTAASCLQAAEISVTPLGPDQPAWVNVDGDLLPRDGDEFQRRTGFLSRAFVTFNSDGGNLVAGIQIGETIRMKNFGTWVPANKTCASACALAWLGGARRYMGSGSRIGFHAAYNSTSGQQTGVGNAMVGAYSRCCARRCGEPGPQIPRS